MAYATAAECKAFTQIPTLKNLADADVTVLIGRAERVINTYTKNDFNLKAAQTFLVDGSGSRRLALPVRLVTLTAVTILSVDDGGTIILSASKLEDVFKYGWHLVSPFTFPFGNQNIKVEGDTGYADVPDEVKDATCLQVERIFLRSKDQKHISGTLKSEKIGDYSYDLGDVDKEGDQRTLGQIEIPGQARLLLSSFKKPKIMRIARHERNSTGSTRLRNQS